ncbi:stage III sporulation protein SpoIIIAB [Paenibacillus koleovorans]|uniref:stage III sporulation protein SpoIIIAB n=1 Tax=Paenibacillus koleovorans TaxID=121608 RepID=UPI000FDCD61C|nr:stage III sporulation protein SpoIIIAB [Paenibacillus koleovorans]
MLKLIGAMLVIAACTLLGLAKAARYARRPRQLRLLIQVLQRLETEMTYGATPLADALRRIAAQAADPIGAMLLDAAERMDPGGETAKASWQEATRLHWRYTALQDSEREVWSQLGFTLGVSDREDQVKHLRLAASLLQTEEQVAWEEQRRYEKMWRSLGVLAGALIVIMMY